MALLRPCCLTCILVHSMLTSFVPVILTEWAYHSQLIVLRCSALS